MQIGIDASRANKSKKTGTEWYAYNLIQQLKNIDKENQYFLYSPNKLTSGLEDLPSNFQEKVLSWKLKYIWTHLRLSWQMLVQPPDILFVPAHSVPLIHRNRTIVTIHDLGFLHNPEIYHPLARLYHRFSAWWSVYFSKKIITISEYTKQDILKNYKIEENKIIVIPLGIDHQVFKKINEQNEIDIIKSKYKIDKEYFLYVGRLEKKKNIQFLLNVWKKFNENTKNCELILAGSTSFGSEKIKHDIKNNKNIKTLGYIDLKELPILYNGAKAFVFPSLFEGFGMILLEAMACGCPILSSNSTSLPEVGQDAVIYFDPKDKNDLFNKLVKIYKDNDLREDLIAKGLSRSASFSWYNTANQTLNFLLK